jgi:hypothetical protein
LGIKSTCWFVEKEEELRFRCQLHTDSEEFTLLNIQALSWHTNNCIGKIFHVQHLDNVLNILVFFLDANTHRLAESGTETQALPHCSSLEVKV